MLITWLTLIFYSQNTPNNSNNKKSITKENKSVFQITSSESWVLLYKNATKQIWIVTKYDFSNWYYSNWWFPPVGIWVCSDVIRMAYGEMNIDIKKLVDEDISKNPSIYKTNFDSNINFRRVKNLKIFFDRNSKILTNELIPNNIKNLETWQVWDIVIFDELPHNHLWHIWIISPQRRDDWVPYMIDNHWDWVNISITPLDWPTKIIGHYRYF